MDDEKIINLYFERDETSIVMTNEKYGAYSFAIANNILRNKEDSDECVNDTWLKLWNSIPPTRPKRLQFYIAKITRNLAFDIYKKMTAEKRGGKEIALVLDELEDCIPSSSSVEEEIDEKELTLLLEKFLKEQSQNSRKIFISRYWYSMSLSEIAQKYSMDENNIKASLFRTRNKLKLYFESEGIVI